MQDANSLAQEVNAALESMREALALDGYDLRVQSNSGSVTIEVVELPGACRECLVGEELFRALVTQALDDAGLMSISQGYDLIYPPVEGQGSCHLDG